MTHDIQPGPGRPADLSAKARGAAAEARRAEAESLGSILARWVKRSGLAHVGDRERITRAWEEILGPEAAHTRLDGLRKGAATFVVDSSTLLSELSNFRRQELLEGLQARVKAPFISDLKFRLEKRA